jgi:hypothetical protein
VKQTVAGGGGDDGHKSINVDIPYKIHTVHHHHVQKFPVYKKIEVPVIKEIKVPFPVHFPVKVRLMFLKIKMLSSFWNFQKENQIIF